MNTVKLNLAPEVYQASQNQKRRKAIVSSLAFVVCLAAIGVVALTLIIDLGQKTTLVVLADHIKSKQNKIQQMPDLPAAATAQEHLSALQSINANKTKFSKFFEALQNFAPQGISVNDVTIDEAGHLKMSASAKSYDLATKFVQVLQTSNVTLGKGAAANNQPYFSDVKLSSVGSNNSTGKSGVGFTITTVLSSEVTNGK